MIEAGAGARPRFAASRVITVLLCAAIAGVAIGIGLHFLLGGSRSTSAPNALARASSPRPGGLYGQATWAAGALAAPAITTLRDQTGHRFAFSSLHGHTALVAFFDSHCNQACPLEGRAIAAAARTLPAAQRPVLVLVSVNPHDTPASVRLAARKWGLAGVGDWHWLMGSHDTLARVWKGYRIFVAPPRTGDIVHTEAIYLIDRQGYQRSGYLYPFASRFVSSDLRTLALRQR